MCAQRSDEELDEYLPRVYVGGSQSPAIVIADYDPRWPDRLATEAARIREALGDRLRAVAGERELYERTKRALAERSWPTGQHYTEAKTEVVEAISARAKACRESGGAPQASAAATHSPWTCPRSGRPRSRRAGRLHRGEPARRRSA